jgi:hypothetical protein
MRTDANQIAFDVVRSILDAAMPLTLEVGGTQVSVVVNREQAPPWPERGFTDVVPHPLLPAAVRAECTWPGGRETLIVDCMRSRHGGYDGDVCLRVARGSRWLVISNVKAALNDVGDGEVAPLVARSPLIRRGAGVALQPELNRALQRLLSSAALKIPSRGKVEIARIRLPDGTIEDGAHAGFTRLVLLALHKLELADREGAAARGTPLVDVAQMDLSPAALAALAASDAEDEGEGDEDDDDPIARLRRRAARLVPDPGERRAALELLAYAVDNAHDERPNGWYTHDRGGCLSLCTGRLMACRLSRGWLELSVMGPISAEVREALGAEVHDNEVWNAIPGGLFLLFPVSKAGVALELLGNVYDQFVDEAMARMHRRIDPDSHVPDVVRFLAEAVERPLPQPDLVATAVSDAEDDDGPDDEVAASREPNLRGRAPIFEHSQRSIMSLLSDIEQGTIALPDLQRPFVWEDTKVRDLLDSLFVGFPVGTVVLWHTASRATPARWGGPPKPAAPTRW